jgi:hypothetical protein
VDGGLMQPKDHWERVYRTKGEQDVSWFESLPTISLKMLEAAGLTRETCVLDVGGGASIEGLEGMDAAQLEQAASETKERCTISVAIGGTVAITHHVGAV